MKRRISLVEIASLLAGIFFGLDQIPVIRDLCQLINENNLIRYSLVTLFLFTVLNFGSWIVSRVLKFFPHFRTRRQVIVTKVCGRIFPWVLTSMAVRHLLLYTRFKKACDAYLFFLSLCLIVTLIIEGWGRKIDK